MADVFCLVEINIQIIIIITITIIIKQCKKQLFFLARRWRLAGDWQRVSVNNLEYNFWKTQQLRSFWWNWSSNSSIALFPLIPCFPSTRNEWKSIVFLKRTLSSNPAKIRCCRQVQFIRVFTVSFNGNLKAAISNNYYRGTQNKQTSE